MSHRERLPSMDYTVTGADSLERIAASHDCTVGELMKLNRMSSRMVFPGQKILVPLSTSDEVFGNDTRPVANSRPARQISGGENAADGIRKGPGGAVPATQQRSHLTKAQSVPTPSSDEVDSDCLQRFLKIKVKQVTESDGTVSGTLLVTPNCLMFDPDVSHPLVKENGQDLYGMVANMDEIVSVSVYKDVGALTGDKAEKKRDIFDPNHVRTEPPKSEAVAFQGGDIELIPESEQTGVPEDPVQRDLAAVEPEVATEAETIDKPAKVGSEAHLPSIDEETHNLKSPEDEKNRRSSDLSEEYPSVHLRNRSSSSLSTSSHEERPRSYSELDANQASQGGFGSRFSPNVARRSFGKLGRTLSARAKSIQGTVTQGTKQVAHGVVTHTKSAADTLQTGIETSVKVVGGAASAAANQAKAAADAVATVPGRMVDMGTSLVSDGINGVQEIFNVEVEEQRSPSQLKREQSLATLEGLKQRTQQARDDSMAQNKQSMFSCATPSDEMSDLFLAVDELVGRRQSTDEAPSSPTLPYYMAVRLTRNRRKTRKTSQGHSSVSSYDEDCAFGNKLKREFWYAVPRSKADNIYHFLLQWSPDKYGQDTTTTPLDEASSTGALNDSSRDDRGFIVLDSTTDESLAGDRPAPLFGSSLLNREWELVTVREMCRRLSLDEIEQLEMPIPEGAAQSQILDELMIRQIMDILPPRAEGYPWVNIYNSEKHGFSLTTLYRKMIEFDEDLSPVLLIVRDTREHVFGAVVSGAIRPSDHYTGTGDSCLLWRFLGEAPHTRELRNYAWTGENQFFVNASKDSLSIGAGGGHYGLWLDADLNHGRSQKCETFDNEPLAGEKEDFIVQFVEAFGFRM
ncbi:unnamed protein product [Cylicocyclus nassatus]|uniref:Oxidation resistance protein 1 n=1 Tax=Cylicocyclus nassatus TaxID=53992 RepID=A0AA36GEF4_CYLNA|nr:unnamed protein product [Cylicocyclus nassatus]